MDDGAWICISEHNKRARPIFSGKITGNLELH